MDNQSILVVFVPNGLSFKQHTFLKISSNWSSQADILDLLVH